MELKQSNDGQTCDNDIQYNNSNLTTTAQSDFDQYMINDCNASKIRMKYILSLLTLGISIFGYFLNSIFLPELSDPGNFDKPVNFTNIGVNLNTTECVAWNLYSDKAKYLKHYDKYERNKNIAGVLDFVAIVDMCGLTLSLFIILEKQYYSNKFVMVKRLSFIVGLIAGFIVYSLMILYINLYLNTLHLYVFLKKRLEVDCIVMVNPKYSIRILSEILSHSLLLIILQLGNFIILLFQIKLLIVLNSFFINEAGDAPICEKKMELESDQIEMKNLS
jgi:hypothetical protein